MILPFLNRLQSKKIILASSSPRRKQLLESIGFSCITVSPSFDESLARQKWVSECSNDAHGVYDASLIRDYVLTMARGKAQSAFHRLDVSPTHLFVTLTHLLYNLYYGIVFLAALNKR
jgi:predicted house-cleaning NTP pyrophosphatase (Maf/HAM1 superfamily)